jgi:hypothetical protein
MIFVAQFEKLIRWLPLEGTQKNVCFSMYDKDSGSSTVVLLELLLD